MVWSLWGRGRVDWKSAGTALLVDDGGAGVDGEGGEGEGLAVFGGGMVTERMGKSSPQ